MSIFCVVSVTANGKTLTLELRFLWEMFK